MIMVALSESSHSEIPVPSSFAYIGPTVKLDSGLNTPKLVVPNMYLLYQAALKLLLLLPNFVCGNVIFTSWTGGKATIWAISFGKKLVVNTVGTELVTSTFDGQGKSALSSVASATAVGKVVSAPMAEELVNRATSSQSRSKSLKSPLDSAPDCSAERILSYCI